MFLPRTPLISPLTGTLASTPLKIFYFPLYYISVCSCFPSLFLILLDSILWAFFLQPLKKSTFHCLCHKTERFLTVDRIMHEKACHVASPHRDGQRVVQICPRECWTFRKPIENIPQRWDQRRGTIQPCMLLLAWHCSWGLCGTVCKNRPTLRM